MGDGPQNHPLGSQLVRMLSRYAEAVGSIPGRAHKESSNECTNEWTNKFLFLSLPKAI